MSGDGLPGPTDSWVTLAAIARETSSIPLGTLVSSATFRYPGPLAISVAQVDEMSGGRVELGLGTGWFEAEHTAYAIPFPPLGERFDRLTEQLHIITGLWRTPVGEKFDYSGTTTPSRTRRRFPSRSNRRTRRSSSEAAAPSARPRWLRRSDRSSMCRSPRQTSPRRSSSGSGLRWRTPDARPNR